MKINNTINSVGNANAPERTRSAAAAPQTPSVQAGERVELSSLSAALQQASVLSPQDPVADAAKVAEIRQAIAEGRFKVDTDRVAEGLLQSVREMLSRQR